MYNSVIIRYGEISLKSTPVRREFLNKLMVNVRACLQINNIKYKDISTIGARIVVLLDDPEKAAKELVKIFGIVSLSPAIHLESDYEKISCLVKDMAKKELVGDKTFVVRSQRLTKDFPLTSQEINERIGAEIVELTKKKVNLTKPDVTFGIEITGKHAFVFTEKFKSYSGLPVGTQGTVVCLISGGIDSPVAAWMMMKRGCLVVPIHMEFSEKTTEKVKEIVAQLNKFCPGTPMQLVVVKFKEILKDISQGLRDMNQIPYTCLFCKRAMYREAEKIAVKEGADAIVSGENLGQVASQTLVNLRAISSATDFPILRPLVSFNKEEIITIAKEIGTYDLSIKDPEKCEFVPSKPRTHSDMEDIKAIAEVLEE